MQGWLRAEHARRAGPRADLERAEQRLLMTKTPSSEPSREFCSRLKHERALCSRFRAEQDPCLCSARSARSRLLETFVPYKIMFYIFDSIKLFRIQSCSYIGLKVCSIQIYLFILFSNGFVRYIMIVCA